MTKIYISLLLTLLSSIAISQKQMKLIKYDQVNTPVFTTNIFKAIGAGKEGHLWVGTANQGIYKYNGKTWVKGNVLTNNNIAQITNDPLGNIWLAQYGATGAQAIGGGVNYFGDTTFIGSTYNSTSGIPTRNTRSIFVNNKMTTSQSNYRVWTAHLGDITGGVTKTGAVGRGTSIASPPFKTITAGVKTTNQLGSCQTIGGNNNQVWVYASANSPTGLNQILRYNTETEAYVSALDELNSGLPLGFIAKSIYSDRNNIFWIGLQTGGVCAYVNGTMEQINFDAIFPSGTIVNNNAITGDEKGNVYIGTSSGLVVYNGGDVKSESSYALYTTANGLPSNNINAIVANEFVYGSYSVGLATSAGIVMWQPDYLTRVYNRVFNKEILLDRGIENIRIAVDSSTGTTIKAFVENAQQCVLRIKEDPAATEVGTYGRFWPVARNPDTITYNFKHPWLQNIFSDQFSMLAHLQVYDTVLNKVVYEESIDFVRPPLMLVHGLFSDGDATFGSFRTKLIQSGMYKTDQVYNANYPASSAMNFTAPIVIAEKTNAMYKALTGEHISCGKLDVAGHSMGTLLLRLYLQSPKYKNDINRYVSINGPHMGSPVPNFVLNNPQLKAAAYFVMGFPEGGALRDLRLNSVPVVGKLIGNVANEVKVPSHAIVTTFNFPATKFEIPTELVSWEQSKILSTLVYVNNGISYWNNTLFEGVSHDGVVSEISQRVGLQLPFYTQISGVVHTSTGGPTASTEVFNTFKLLMNTSANNMAVYTTGGFKPTQIRVPDNLFRAANTKSGTLAIASPANNVSVQGGQEVTLNLNYTAVDTMIVMLGNPESGIYASRIDAPNTTFKFQMPKEFLGKVKLQIMGYNSNGYTAQDSLYFNVTTNAVLDTIIGIPSELRVPKTGNVNFKIQAQYSDTSRNITGNSDIKYTFLQNKASFESLDKINGLIEGLDTMKVSYKGKQTLVPVIISPADEWVTLDQTPLPSKLIFFTAAGKNRQTLLNWKTANEDNTSYYEIEYSKNGVGFTALGKVNAKGSNNNYTFTHLQLQPGRNYYRLKMTDRDGTFEYSPIRMVAFSSNVAISLHPSPAKDYMTFQLSAANKTDFQVLVLSLEGKVLQTLKIKNTDAHQQQINVSSLAKGFYLLKVSSNEDNSVIKFEKL